LKSLGIAGCKFCDLVTADPDERATRTCFENVLFLVIEDAYPVSPGHTLVIPKRHGIDFTTMEPGTIGGLGNILFQETQRVMRELGCDGVNVGTNVGSAAGQTIFHTHWHIIPRWEGDSSFPTGGIRKVINGNGSYEERPED
jgi:diadenosine tetraphosphate (Ap4A) HIT family hydrolase